VYHHKNRLAGVSAAIAGVIALAAPAFASAAPTIEADLPCYVPGQTITLGGSGFVPNDDVVFFLALSGQHGHQILYSDPYKPDATGALTTQLHAPDLASDSDREETVDLTANDQTLTGTNLSGSPPEGGFAATQFLLSRFDAVVDAWRSGRADPHRTGRLTVSGWEPYHAVWAHYFLGRKRVRSIRIGTAGGLCGDLTKTIRQFPFRPVKAGTWTVYFSPGQVFDRNGMWVRSKHLVVPKSKAIR